MLAHLGLLLAVLGLACALRPDPAEARNGRAVTCQADGDCDDANSCTSDTCNPSDPAANAAGCVNAPVLDGTPCTDGNVCNGNETCQSGQCSKDASCTTPGSIVFSFMPPTSGSIAYNGTGGPLTATGIQVDTIIGVGTPSNAGLVATCVGCTMSFSTGALKSTGPDSWTFNAGGTLSVNGAVDFNGGGIGSGDIPNGLLVAGTFASDVTVTMSGATLKIMLGDVADEKHFGLRNKYGIVVSTFSGQLGLSFTATATPPSGFSSSGVLSGTLSNAKPGCEDRIPAPPGTSCDADGSLCTVDQCDGLGNCVLTSTPGCPDDGQVCNGAESCDPATGQCVSGPPAPINTTCDADGNLCTHDACDGAGSCNFVQVVSCTDDGNACNGPEACNPSTGTCGSGPPATVGTPCETDGDTCTVEQCNGGGSCVLASFAGNATPCDDGLFCNGADRCNGAGQCSVHLGSPCAGTACNGCQEATDTCFDPAGTACNSDGNLCTVEECNGAGGCVLTTTTVCPDDGQLCNGPEACNPTTGTCVSGPPKPLSTPCEADGNICTIDHCDGLGACTLLANASSGTTCDDGLFCNGTDTCNGNGMCSSHSGDPCPGTECNMCQEATDSCFDPPQTQCDDGDVSTSHDVCDGAGNCMGTSIVRDYAILRWFDNMPQPRRRPRRSAKLSIQGQTRVGGIVCVDTITMRPFSVVEGDAIAVAMSKVAIKFFRESTVLRNVVTGGGTIKSLEKAIIGGTVSTTGAAPELADCRAATLIAETERIQLKTLPVSAGLSIGKVIVPTGGSLTLTMPAGQAVVEAESIKLRKGSTLTLVGNPNTTEVIVRVTGRRGVRLARASSWVLQGLAPEQVLLLIEGRFYLGAFAELSGTIFAGNRVYLARESTLHGQIVGQHRITLAPFFTLDVKPFVGF